MLKKSKNTLAIMCCLMLTFTSVAFADASKGEGVSKEAVSEKNTYSFNISGYVYTYENAPQKIRDEHKQNCEDVNIAPKPDDKIFVPTSANLMNDDDKAVYTNYAVAYKPDEKTITVIGGGEFITISTTKVIRKGDTGKEVTVAQIMLSKLGYNTSPDGIFGSKTYNAVVSVQKKYGLSADGVIGPATWDKLGRLTDSSF
ncbi:peptidoglycan-binding protein [Clostridioides difficile]|uniref:peptidoglycan-binding domain-containing protein n=1 Tax=Clostridioides difficile TaxID=1496 RepID=UPI00038DB9AE|nr:peptidoglycan-binding domain-containing protein [Clostridioides difficile]EIS9730756.1 peptidoglycan-binding protein [Clostridioides difficile]EQJ79162.1 putative peptidoglycan binding domain protein [Clostridioides difficile P46]MBF9963621.1 peptidoglycan-binding protein [Clostridioides difficile]MBH6917775.1 peptidoglycan-binding protein [Clostridioides difficile]MBH7695025.1 peptidoglycan-binding protein [Clostridioides difficile]